MARPSSAETKERIEFERLRNADLIGVINTAASPASVMLSVLDVLTAWWHKESVRLESSSKRADATNRKEFRVAARQAEAIATSIRQVGVPEPPRAEDAPHAGPLVPAISSDGLITMCGVRGPDHKVCARHPHEPGDGDHMPRNGTVADGWPSVETEGTSNPVLPLVDPTAPSSHHRLTFAELAQSPPKPPPPHRSVSQVTTYSSCGLKYRLQRRHDIVARPSWSFIGGKTLHAVVEEVELLAAAPGADWASVRSTFDLSTLWETHLHHEMSQTLIKTPGWPMESWYAAARGAEGYTWWLAEGADMVRRYITWRTEWDKEWVIARDDAGAPIVEYPVLVVSDISVKGVIDQAWISRSGTEMMIVDVKTGKRKPDDNLQLRTYGHALTQTLSLPARGCTAAYWSARTGQLSEPMPATPEGSWDELRWRVGQMDAADRADIHLPQPSSFCSACSVEHACPLRGV